MENLKKLYKNTYNLLKQFRYSKDDHNSLLTPFFFKSDELINIDNLSFKDCEFINKFEYMPILIKLLYNIMDPQLEAYFNEWTFISLNNIKEIYDKKVNKGQNDILDFAFCYEGMGWIYIAAVDLKSGKIFLRLDGGSNDYDRQYNFENIIKFKIDSSSNKYILNKDFEKLISNNFNEEQGNKTDIYRQLCVEY